MNKRTKKKTKRKEFIIEKLNKKYVSSQKFISMALKKAGLRSVNTKNTLTTNPYNLECLLNT